MTRKHFRALAKILERHGRNVDPYLFNSLVDEFAEYLVTENPLFNSEQFDRACGKNLIPDWMSCEDVERERIKFLDELYDWMQ